MEKKIISKIKLMFVPIRENGYRPKFLASQFLIYYLIALSILKLITIPSLIYISKSIFFADLTKTALIELTNQEREVSGMGSLKENLKLNEAAYLKAKDILEKDYFSHQSPEGITPWYWFERAGYGYDLAGENLAIGFLDSDEVHKAWMDSFSHRQNLLNPNYQEIGLAVAQGDFQGSEATVVVQLFGVPKTVMATETEKVEVVPEAEEKTSAETPEEISEPLVLGLSSFMAFDYHDLIQKIVYVSLILIIISLIVNIFVRFDIQDKALIFKTLVFILLLVFFILVDKELIIQIIPHNFSIY